jgi:hypothetical protein
LVPLEKNPSPRRRSSALLQDGGNRSTVVSGTRNPTALAFHPDTGDLWALVQERDGLGDSALRLHDPGPAGRVPRLALRLYRKAPDAGFAQLAPDKAEATIGPDPLLTARCSIWFYTRATSSWPNTKAASLSP